jgi:PEP-CTERM motif
MIKFFAALLTASAATLLPCQASAIVVSLDHPELSVVRPTTGTVELDFTGHITVTTGYWLQGVKVDFPNDATGDYIALPKVDISLGFIPADGVLFSEVIKSTDAVGHYAYSFGGHDPIYVEYTECPLQGAGGCNGYDAFFSVDVTAPVDEPETVALMGLGLLGLASKRVRRGSVRLATGEPK